jgi:hypothetical protein
MWALGDQATRAGVQEVLERSVAEVIGWAEDHGVFCTRTGARGVRQEPVVGVDGLIGTLRKTGRGHAIDQ